MRRARRWPPAATLGADSVLPGDSGGYVFFVQAGIREQARALVAHAATGLAFSEPRLAVVHPAEPGLADAAGAALADARARGWRHVEPFTYARGRAAWPQIAAELNQRGIEAVLFLGNDSELESFVRQAQALGFAPTLLLSGSLCARAAAGVAPAFGTLVPRLLLAGLRPEAARAR